DKLLAACGDTLIGLRDKVMVSVGFDTLCRGGELVSLSVDDLTRNGNGRFEVLVRRAKNDPEGAGRSCKLSARSSGIVDQWLEARASLAVRCCARYMEAMRSPFI